MGITELRKIFERKKGQLSEINTQITSLTSGIRDLKRDLRNHIHALEIVKEVGLKTQQQLQYHISDITSMALESVFPDPYELKINFVERRNASECDIVFVRDGQEIDPLSASGGGTVDIAAFALRIAAWSLQQPHSRNTIILDEPMRFVSAEYQEKASSMIKEISQKLGIQFIIVTHSNTLASYADKVFTVSIKNKISKVE